MVISTKPGDKNDGFLQTFYWGHGHIELVSLPEQGMLQGDKATSKNDTNRNGKPF